MSTPISVPQFPTYFDVLLPRAGVRGHHYWAAGSATAVLGCVIAFGLTHQPQFLTTFLPLGLGIGLVPLVVRAGFSILLDWHPTATRFIQSDIEQFNQWFFSRFDAYIRGGDVLIAAAVYLIAAIAAFRASGAFSGMGPGGVTFASAVLAVSAFCCGVGIATLLRLANLVWSLGRYPVEVVAGPYGVSSTGPMLLKIYVLAGITWVIYTSSAGWNLSSGWVPVLILSVPAVALIFGSFVVAQIPLHRRMVEFKRGRVYEIESMLRELTPKKSSDLTEERLHQIAFLREECSKVTALPDWPFGWRSLSAAFATSIGSVAPTLIAFAMGQIFPSK